MVMPIKDPDFVKRLIPLMQQIGSMPFQIGGYIKYIEEVLPYDGSLLLVDIDDEGLLKSFLFAETIISITDKEMFINLAYYDPSNKKIGKEMQKYVELFADYRQCSHLAILTQEDRVKAYTKKYGFTDKIIYLRKKLNGKVG